MKTLALKLGSLLLLLCGVYALGKHFQVAQIQALDDAFLAAFAGDSGKLLGLLSLGHVKVLVGTLLFLLGLYGLLPRIPGRRGLHKISFDGPHGPVEIQLDPVEASLNRIIGKLPEIKKAKILVTPGEDGRVVSISAKVILLKQPGYTSRQTAMGVSDHIASAATEQLGLEDIASIQLNIAGIQVDPKAAKADLGAGHERPAVVPTEVAEMSVEVEEAPVEVAEEYVQVSAIVEEPEADDFSFPADDDVTDISTRTLPEAEPVAEPVAEPEAEPVAEPVPVPVVEPDEPELVVAMPIDDPVSDDEPVVGIIMSEGETEDSTGFDVIGDAKGGEEEEESSERKDESSSGWSF